MLVRAERCVDLCMKECHLRQVPRRHGKQARKVLPDVTRRVADGGDVADGLATMVVDQDPSGRGVRGDTYTCGPLNPSRPNVGRPRIVISGRVDDSNSVVTEPLCLLQQEALGLKREAVSIEQVARDQECVDVLSDRYVDRITKRHTGRIAKSRPHVRGASRESGVQMYVGDVQEAHGPS